MQASDPQVRALAAHVCTATALVKRKRCASSVVQLRHPAIYKQFIFLTYLKDLRGAEHTAGSHLLPYPIPTVLPCLHSVAAAANAGLVTAVVDFFFWRWPFISTFAFVLWQFLVSMPSMLPAVIPLIGVAALVRSYLAVRWSLQPMRNRLSICSSSRRSCSTPSMSPWRWGPWRETR